MLCLVIIWISLKTMVDQLGSPTRFACIIGAQRSGSTWLHQMLDSHPEIEMAKPVAPEPKFFLRSVDGPEARENYLQQYFSNARTWKVLGEKSTSYIEHPEVISRMLSLFPQAKAIAILRHPVSRAISNYRFSVQRGLETRSLREVFVDELPAPPHPQGTSVDPFNYVGRSHYMQHLQPWMDALGSQLRIEIMEEIQETPERLQDLYAWLGVERDHVPPDFRSAPNAIPEQDRGAVDLAVIRKLSAHFAPLTPALEEQLGRRISHWHDPL